MTQYHMPGCQTTAGCKCRKIVTRPRPDLGPGYFDLVEDGRKLTTVLTIPRWAAEAALNGEKGDQP